LILFALIIRQNKETGRKEEEGVRRNKGRVKFEQVSYIKAAFQKGIPQKIKIFWGEGKGVIKDEESKDVCHGIFSVVSNGGAQCMGTEL
jgi:hypothetical protein